MEFRAIADRQLEQRRDISPKQKRRIKREVRAMPYAHQARNGGGARERLRRQAQIGYGAFGYGQLRFENGLSHYVI